MTSTEFLERLHYIDMVETQHDRRDYMLASIVAEIRSFKEGFSESPKSVSLKDCLLFNKDEESDEDESKVPISPEESKVPISPGARPDVPRLAKGTRKKGQELGKPMSDKWKNVTANAKAVWAARFGIVAPPLEDPQEAPEEPEEDDDGSYW